jgi:hypothetical protein
MKRLTKKKYGLLNRKMVFVVDKNLNNLKPEDFASEKLADANERLKKIKFPPKSQTFND